MKCQICNTNDANIVFTQIVNNEKIVMQLCSDCAKNKGLTIEIKHEAPQQIESLVGSLTGDIETDDTEEKPPDISCDECGLTFAEFKKSGLFGCDNCHRVFDGDQHRIAHLLKQIHGQSKHEGKGPVAPTGEAEIKKEIRSLRSKLDRFIELEEYENAAEIRDRINTLEKENSENEL